MKQLSTISVAVLLALLGSNNDAAAYAESPTQAIRRTNRTLNTLLRKKVRDGTPAAKRVEARLKKAVKGFLDFEELARRSLGKHWKKRTAVERAEFTGILAALIERNYVKQLRSNLSYRLEYRDEKVKDGAARVITVVKIEKNGRTEAVEIEYRMRKTARGWMVYDVITDEVSVVRNYRSQFNRIIRRDSYEVLVKKMRRKLERI